MQAHSETRIEFTVFINIKKTTKYYNILYYFKLYYNIT